MTEHKAKTISNSPSPYKVYDEAYNKGRADERKKVLDGVLESVNFEEKWLHDAIREDKGNYEYNIDIAFCGIKNVLKQLKEQK